MSNEKTPWLGELLRAPGEVMGFAEGKASCWRLAAFLTLVTAVGCATKPTASAANIHVRTTINAAFSVETENSHRIGDNAARRLPSVAVKTRPSTAMRAAESFAPLIVAKT